MYVLIIIYSFIFLSFLANNLYLFLKCNTLVKAKVVQYKVERQYEIDSYDMFFYKIPIVEYEINNIKHKLLYDNFKDSFKINDTISIRVSASNNKKYYSINSLVYGVAFSVLTLLLVLISSMKGVI